MQFHLQSGKLLSATLLSSSVFALAACGAGNSSSSTAPIDGASSNATNTTSADARSKAVNGPLDPLQSAVVTDVLGGTIASALPAPLGPTVYCLSDALNSLVDGPDALLASLSALPSGGDPAAAFTGAADQLTGAMERFAAELQGALAVLAGTQASCSTVASGGSPFAIGAGNPLAGTPLEDVGSALTDLMGGLGGFGGSNGDDPDLRGLTNALQPLLIQLASAMNQVPQEARNAPVIGGLFATIQTAVMDLHSVMPAVGAYDSLNTQVGLESLLGNLLDNVLTGVIPVEMIDENTGQDFSGQIRAGIAQATAAFGNGAGSLITPLFDQALNGALEPLLDPVEGLIAQLLNPVGLNGANPFAGVLGNVAGNGSANQLDVLLGLLSFGAAGNPLSQLSGAVGSSSTGSPLDQLTGLLGNGGLPLDSLLGQLQTGSNGAPLGGLLDGLLGEGGLLGGLLGG